jgi:TRAP-type C4-dicarboxylate transport system substrate-binding protein
MYFQKTNSKFKGLSVLLVLVLVIGVFAGCGGGAAAPETPDEVTPVETIELSLSTMWGANHKFVTTIVPQWNEYLMEATDGEVQLTVYPGGTLTPAGEAYEGVVQGISDMAVVSYALTRGRFPVIETLQVPGIQWNNAMASGSAFDEAMRILQPAEHADTQFLFGFSPGPGELQSQKPVRTMEDLKGLPILVNSGVAVDAMTLLGASPVMMPTPEWYEALQRGVANAGLISGEVLEGFRQFEVNGNYITATPFMYNMSFGVMINHDTWNKLSPKAQEALQVRPDGLLELFNELNFSAYALNKTNKDVEVIYLSDTEVERWKKVIEPVMAKHLAALEEKGIDSAKVYKTIQELAVKWNAEFPDVNPYLKGM